MIVRFAPVSTFLIVTVTSRRAAPAWSVTTPERLAPVWAHAGIAGHRKRASTAVKRPAVRMRAPGAIYLENPQVYSEYSFHVKTYVDISIKRRVLAVCSRQRG